MGMLKLMFGSKSIVVSASALFATLMVPTASLAQKDMNKACAKQTCSVERINQLWMELENGQYQSTLQDASCMVEFCPASGEMHYIHGLALGFDGQLSESKQAFDKSRQLGYKLDLQ